MEKVDDVLEFAGMEGCAADREYAWHLGADKPDKWDRFPGAMEWEWEPGRGCDDLRPMSKENMVRDMVEEGGWLLIGDSVTENHFFSLSCLLYPHVRATPNYTENPYFDRAWPQHLYLSPQSPLLPSLSLPPGFSISSTPLVTFRRVDLLLSGPELESLYATSLPALAASKPLFSDEKYWSLSPKEYVDDLFLPGRYSTLVLSTGGHWTTTLLSAFRDDSAPQDGYGISGVLAFFHDAMALWASTVQRSLDSYRSGSEYDDLEGASGATPNAAAAVPKRVVVRAYLPGHEDCHDYGEPWTAVKPMRWNWYNWASIKDFNSIFETLLNGGEGRRRYPDLHFLPIDRPALLRPDAHAAGDCLHIMTGAGVLEGWSHYIWHFVTREIPAMVR
ncbi:hypothetical protein PUNSTDRAFT_82721 [Punctularia strigosozonata HHB-11173 SS5]|uniref:uncharacterized protein n=1 Tax=Punctularia strigosozonata (strain HHB-11173) TaxID=741275 RepID=UPI0004416D93|nr:uncharacterized protein PUNSTDRAFT_82721 [Punctularia strigosozonata HHB-11173 SS5]EIN11174.1 hypothetical protein PUNSTDRAFT_82721 [Punctularia strigosozonata HHB-11173 SS5]